MSGSTRPARAEDVSRLWPAVKAARLMASADELAAFREAGPWRVRVNDFGEALLLAPWRSHLSMLAIRGLWAAPHRVTALVDDAAAVARAQGFSEVLSPLATEAELPAYLSAGMQVLEPIVALQGLAQDIAARPVISTVGVQIATRADLDAVVGLDAACFDEFWRYGPHEVGECMTHDRVTLAEKHGVLVGYATCSLHGASATVGRLAVSPEARRQGVASALLRDAASFALRSEAFAITLCTQRANADSRALYETMSFRELPETYTLAARRA